MRKLKILALGTRKPGEVQTVREGWGDSGSLNTQDPNWRIHLHTSLKTVFTEQYVFFNICFIISIFNFFSSIFSAYFTWQVTITSFGWRRSEFSQSPNCWSSCNVWGKKGEGVVVGGRLYRCGDGRGWCDFCPRSIGTRFFNLTATLKDWLFSFNAWPYWWISWKKIVEEYFLHPN